MKKFAVFFLSKRRSQLNAVCNLPFYVINGKLFQVLSSTVGMELRVRGYSALSEFILKIDYWFDLLNTGLRDGKSKNKPHMEPYRDPCDERLEWLMSFPGITKQRYLKLSSSL